jgi:hypothetical protein
MYRMEFTETQNRRRFSRINFDGEATIRQHNQSYPVQLLDISIKGVLIKVNDPEAITPQPAVLRISLSDCTCIEMQIALAHRNENYLGFRCDSIEFESAAHLRRLIELNLNIPDAAERVLDELVTPLVGPPHS